MPYTTRIIDGGTGIHRKGIGMVKGEEILAANNEIQSLGLDLSKLTHVLVDFEEATGLKVSTEETKLIAERVKDSVDAGIWKPQLIAIAAPSDLIFGMSRMFSIFAENGALKINTFRTMQEARTWIDEELAHLKSLDQS